MEAFPRGHGSRQVTRTPQWRIPFLQVLHAYTKAQTRERPGHKWGAMPTTSGSIVDFRIAPSNNQIIYAAKSTSMAKSTNGGTSFTSITGTLPVGSANITRIAVKSTDPNYVWVSFSGYSSTNKVFKSTNGGTTWTNITTGLPNLPVNCVMYGTGLNNDAVYAGTDVGVYFIDNTFTTWQPYLTGLPNVVVFDLEIYASTGKIRAATYGRGVWEVDAYVPTTSAPVAQFVYTPLSSCVGSAVNFTDQSSGNPTGWAWTFTGGTPASATSQNPSGVVWNTAGTYNITLTATNSLGSNSTTQSITVNPSPTVNASASNNTVCSGVATTLNASGATTYLWSPGGSTSSNPSVSPTSTTTYTVTGTTNGCSGTSSVTITVNAAPNITATANPASVCPGSGTTLSATGGGTTYTWTPGGATGASITVNPTATTTYTVSSVGSNGCTGTRTITVSLLNQPSVSASTSNATICKDSSTTLTASGASTYSWMPGGMTGASVTVSPIINTTYTVTGTSGSGCTNTGTVSITVAPVPPMPSFTTAGNLLTAVQSGSAYQWYLNGAPISGATAQSYTATQGGNYSVVVFDANGCPSPQSNTQTITGISPGVDLGGTIVLFPNPNDGRFTLTFSFPEKSDYTFEIHNAIGQLVYEDKLHNFSGTSSKTVDLSKAGKGIYLLSVKNATGKVVKEIMVQ